MQGRRAKAQELTKFMSLYIVVREKMWEIGGWGERGSEGHFALRMRKKNRAEQLSSLSSFWGHPSNILCREPNLAKSKNKIKQT